jgi:cellulose synthase (UDP-forming)
LPRVGWVQTRQRFLVPEGDPYSNEDNVFYDVMQRGKDSHNAAFSCGSGVIYRRAALESVGGFSTWNLVEDVHTSMRLHDKGWRSIYYDHALSTGTTPLETRGMYRQREQWALDSLRLLFWDSPFRQKGLSLVQKMQYFQIGFTYLVSGFVMPVFLLVPAWSLFTGNFIIHTSVWLYVLYRGIYLLTQTLGFFLLNHPSDPSGKAYRQWIGLFPVFMMAAFRALGSRSGKPEYKVNRKPGSAEIGRAQVMPVLPQLMIFVLTIAACIYGYVKHTLPWTVYAIDVVWSTWVLWSLWAMIRASIQRKRPPALSV